MAVVYGPAYKLGDHLRDSVEEACKVIADSYSEGFLHTGIGIYDLDADEMLAIRVNVTVTLVDAGECRSRRGRHLRQKEAPSAQGGPLT